MQIKSIVGRGLWSDDHKTIRETIIEALIAGADLTGANLTDASLACANLARASLADANLAGANLAGANLTGADLTGANLTDASLACADLGRANLTGADLTGANLADANLAGAKISEGITVNRAPIHVAGLRWHVMIWDAHMQIGCEFHSLADWYGFEHRRIVRMDRDALKFWRAHKAALFALAASDGRWKDAS